MSSVRPGVRWLDHTARPGPSKFRWRGFCRDCAVRNTSWQVQQSTDESHRCLAHAWILLRTHDPRVARSLALAVEGVLFPAPHVHHPRNSHPDASKKKMPPSRALGGPADSAPTKGSKAEKPSSRDPPAPASSSGSEVADEPDGKVPPAPASSSGSDVADEVPDYKAGSKPTKAKKRPAKVD